MNDLGRDAERLIAAARGQEGPTSAQRAELRSRVLLRVGSAVAVSAVASTTAGASAAASIAPAAAATAGAALLTKIVVGVAILGALGTGAAVTVHRRARDHAPVPVATTGVGSFAHATLDENRSALALPAPDPEAPRDVEPASASLPASNARSAPPSRRTREPSLEADLNVLRNAQDEIRSGHADRALALLGDRSASAGDGALGEERRAARIVALCSLGRVDDARAETDRFVRASPKSPLLPRVRDACKKSK